MSDLLEQLSDWEKPSGTIVKVNNQHANVVAAEELGWKRVGRSPKGLSQAHDDAEAKAKAKDLE